MASLKRSNSKSAKLSVVQDQQKNDSKFTLRFLLPSRCVGMLIGSKGEKITALKKQHKAIIHISKNKNVPERVVTITMTLQGFPKCLKQILNYLNRYDEMKNSDGDIQIRFLIDESFVKTVVGKGGSQINEWRKQFCDVKLYVFEDNLFYSTERIFAIAGPNDKIVKIMMEIINLIKNVPISDSSRHYDPKNYDPQVHGCYVKAEEKDNSDQKIEDYSATNSLPAPYAKITTSISIPKNIANWMIRYNSERIESIRERFEVEIDFSLAVPESNKRIITLYGSPCMSVSAYSQLMQIVESFMAAH